MKPGINEEGFTLIEIMASLVIGLLIISAFSWSLINGIKTENRVDKRLKARRITNSIIENLRTNKYRDNLNDNLTWEETGGQFKNINIKFDSEGNISGNTDILISVTQSSILDKLYSIKINWVDRNYNTEILLAGE